MVKWQGRQGSSNIEDRRGQSSGGLGGGFGRSGGFGSPGGGMRIPIGGRSGGMGGIIILVIILGIAWAMGINPLTILTGGGSSTDVPFQQTLPPQNANQDELANFVGVMVKDTEDYLGNYFKEQGDTYTAP